ncbi:MAG TPA: MazG family protein [Thermomicrobiales bacterium]|nr:MazG family protein [Thermomicrobiales bacterium]
MTVVTPDITIVGLGPGDPGQRTIAVQRALDSAARIFVRTHPDVDLSDLVEHEHVTDVASLRQPDTELGGRWQVANDAVCDAAADGPVVLAIPGHPRFGEGLVVGTLNEAARRGLSTRVLDGISVVDLMATTLGIDPLLQDAQFFNAREFGTEDDPQSPFMGGMFTGSPLRPMLLTHVYDQAVMAGVARALARVLPHDHSVIRIVAAGMPDEEISHHTVGELPIVPSGPLVALWVPAQGDLEAGRDPRTLQHIVARLRRPDGCPWDREQTHESLRDNIVDEAYEVMDAIDAGDPVNLVEELGDLFLLICMHAQIAEENGTFTLEDVYQGISSKIIRRHPHVFGDAVANEASDLAEIWAGVKAQEKADNPLRAVKGIDGQPHSMPALVRAPKVLRKYPLTTDMPPSTQDDRSRELLRAVAAIIMAGDDPEHVLRDALAEHVTGNATPP